MYTIYLMHYNNESSVYCIHGTKHNTYYIVGTYSYTAVS